jgi:hypothetical protein
MFRVETELSYSKLLSAGATQGFLLSPILFFLYIFDKPPPTAQIPWLCMPKRL